MVDAATLGQTVLALAGGGFSTALMGHLFGWRKSREETKTTLQALVDDRLKTLLSSDEARLKQMSDSLDRQGTLIEGFQRTIAEQSERVEQLENVVKTLGKHIASLEALLRQRKIEPPPRPDVTFFDAGGSEIKALVDGQEHFAGAAAGLRGPNGPNRGAPHAR